MGLCDRQRTGNILAPYIKPQTTRQAHQSLSSCIAEFLHMQLWEWNLSCLVAPMRIDSVTVTVICRTKLVTIVTSGLTVHRTNCFICPFDTLSQKAVDVRSSWLSIVIMFTRFVGIKGAPICRPQGSSFPLFPEYVQIYPSYMSCILHCHTCAQTQHCKDPEFLDK